MTARSGRRSVTLWTAGCVVLLVAAMVSGLGGTVPALAFRQAGHWVYNSTAGAVFHVDGGSRSVDSRMALPGLSPANQVVQDDQHGYVVDHRNGRVLVFGKSTLSVDSTLSVGTDEQPTTLEVNGGPYLVYGHGGRIIRLGQPPATVAAGGPLRTPIATSNGTLWVQRSDNGALCTLAPGTAKLACPDHVPANHHGGLTTLDDHPAFVDTSAGTVRLVTSKGLGHSKPLGITLPPNSQVASSDAGGRLPILTPNDDRRWPSLVLVDTSTIGIDRPAAKPITVPLDRGRFDTPVATGGAIAIVDRTARKILTYTNQGTRKAAMALSPQSGDVQVSHGEDGRVYIDNAAGTQTYIVDGDGGITSVRVGGHDNAGPPASTAPSTNPPSSSSTTPAPDPTPSTNLPPVPPSPPPTSQPPTTPPPVAPTTPPGAPPSVQALAGDGQATVTWTAPATNGSPIVNYLVSWRAVSGGGPVGSVIVPGSTRQTGISRQTAISRQTVISRQTAITGLRNGTSYVVAVAARNLAGTGPATDSAAFVPDPELVAPISVQATAHPDGSVTVDWPAVPRTVHGAVRFTVNSSGGRTLARTSRTRATITGLALGQAVRFTVTASDGESQKPSAPTAPVIPFRAAGAPGGLTAKPGVGRVLLSWTAPPTNGGTFVHYLVSGAGADRTTASPKITITGLKPGIADTFTVRAVTRDPNGSGTSVNGTPTSIRAAPVAVPVVRILDAWWSGYDQMSIRVTVDDGGSPATCRVLVQSLIQLADHSCDSQHLIVIDGVNSDEDNVVPLTVTGTNAAGQGPVSNTFDLQPGDTQPNGRSPR